MRLKRAKARASARELDDGEFMRATVGALQPIEKQTVMWDGWPNYRGRRRLEPIGHFKAVAARNGNRPIARYCQFEPGTPECRPVFSWPDASVATDESDRKSRS